MHGSSAFLGLPPFPSSCPPAFPESSRMVGTGLLSLTNSSAWRLLAMQVCEPVSSALRSDQSLLTIRFSTPGQVMQAERVCHSSAQLWRCVSPNRPGSAALLGDAQQALVSSDRQAVPLYLLMQVPSSSVSSDRPGSAALPVDASAILLCLLR